MSAHIPSPRVQHRFSDGCAQSSAFWADDTRQSARSAQTAALTRRSAATQRGREALTQGAWNP